MSFAPTCTAAAPPAGDHHRQGAGDRGEGGEHAGAGRRRVDILRAERGPLVMEVNASPGLEGVETTTGLDIAGMMIEYIEQRGRLAFA